MGDTPGDRSRGARGPWVLATLIGIAVVAGVALLFRAPPAPPLRPPAGIKPTMEMHAAPSGDTVFNQVNFKDPVPLFLPTVWNSSPPERQRREPEGVFRDFEPRFAFQESDLKLNLPVPIAVPARPADALEANPPGNPFLGLGEVDMAVPAARAAVGPG